MTKMLQYLFPFIAVALLFSSCSDNADSPSNDSPNTPEASGSATLTLRLTDAPGDLVHAWVEINQITLTGETDDDEEISITLFSGTTGMIDLLTLADATTDLVADHVLPSGTYKQLSFDFSSAVVETRDGQVLALSGSRHPDGKAITGELICGSCTPQRPNVKLPNNSLQLNNQAKVLLLDFDVSQSFGRDPSGSDSWYMRPAIFAADLASHGTIAGRVALNNGVNLPTCGGQTSTLEQVIVRAFDAADAARSGTTAPSGTYRIAYVVPGRYGMLIDPSIEFDTETLAFTALPSQTQVVVDAGSTETVDFAITSATCRDRL